MKDFLLFEEKSDYSTLRGWYSKALQSTETLDEEIKVESTIPKVTILSILKMKL
jgi:hypothetical protein